MYSRKNRKADRIQVRRRIRGKISGTAERPRLAVFRSTKHIYAQAIDDLQGKTLAAASTLDGEAKVEEGASRKVAAAKAVGELIAKRLTEKGVRKVIFDRGGFVYHGRVKALADAARKHGLEF